MLLTQNLVHPPQKSDRFEILSTTSQFFFPAALKPLRFLEPLLAPTLLGAQYMVLCRKSDANSR